MFCENPVGPPTLILHLHHNDLDHFTFKQSVALRCLAEKGENGTEPQILPIIGRIWDLEVGLVSGVK